MEEGPERVRKEHEQRGFDGRFGPGLPRVSDGSMLFLLHLLSKMRPPKTAAAASASCSTARPLVHGRRGQWQSEIRRYVLENDLVPGHRGPAQRHVLQHRHWHLHLGHQQPQAQGAPGKVQLIDASGMWQKMRKAWAASAKN